MPIHFTFCLLWCTSMYTYYCTSRNCCMLIWESSFRKVSLTLRYKNMTTNSSRHNHHFVNFSPQVKRFHCLSIVVCTTAAIKKSEVDQCCSWWIMNIHVWLKLERIWSISKSTSPHIIWSECASNATYCRSPANCNKFSHWFCNERTIKFKQVFTL